MEPMNFCWIASPASHTHPDRSLGVPCSLGSSLETSMCIHMLFPSLYIVKIVPKIVEIVPKIVEIVPKIVEIVPKIIEIVPKGSQLAPTNQCQGIAECIRQPPRML